MHPQAVGVRGKLAPVLSQDLLREVHENVSKQLLESARECSSRDSYWGRQDAMRHAVKGQGFSDLNEGRGSFCLGVLEHPDLPKRVYKLVHTAHDADDLYIDYAEWVYENRLWERNPHFPRIFDISYTEDQQVALVVLEKLEEFEWDKAPEYLQDDYYIARKGLGMEPLFLPEGWAATNRPLTTAAEAIRQQFKDLPKVRFDLHKGNVMLRGEIMVIIDPIVTS